MSRKGLTQEQFEALQRASREELLEVLADFVKKKRGRPKSESALSGAERTRRWRARTVKKDSAEPPDKVCPRPTPKADAVPPPRGAES
jgi:hypothetical protein